MKFDFSNAEVKTPPSASDVDSSPSLSRKQRRGRKVRHIKKFPRQLRKRFYDTVEPRFLVILLSSIFLHVSIILYLSENFPRGDKFDLSKGVRDHFANLLLDGSRERGMVGEISEAERPNRFDFHELGGETISGGELTNLDPDLESKDLSALTVERLKAERDMRLHRRIQFMDDVSKELERIGLLAILTSMGRRDIKMEEVADILDYADSTKNDLETSLSFLTGLRVPRRYAVANSYSSSNDILKQEKLFSTAVPPVRGARNESKAIAKEVVDELAEVHPVSIKKVKTFEPVSATSLLDKVSWSHGNGSLARERSSREVAKVVSSHSSAIQDCYNHELRYNPDLSGKVVVRIVVAPSGNVIGATVLSSSLSNDDLVDCMISRILRWNDFPPIHPSSGNMAIKQGYAFGPSH